MLNSVLLRRLALCAILAAASLLRWQYFLQIEHNIDHAHSVWQALRTLHYGELPIIGLQSSVLVPHPALMGYLFIPFMGLTRTIIAVYVFIIALNTLAVYITYRTLHLMLGSFGALFATALIAVNPWVIEYGRLSWHPGLMPLCVSLFFWAYTSVLLGHAQKPARRMVLALLLLTVMSQMVLISYFLLLPVGVLALVYWRRIPWRAFIAGMIIFAAVNGLYVASLVMHQQAYSGRVTQFVENTATAQLKPDAILHALRLVSGRDYEIARGTQAPIQDSDFRHILSGNFAVPIVEILVGIGTVLAIMSLFTRRNTKTAAIVFMLLVWFFVPILAMSYNASPVHPYYLLVTLPAGAALAALPVVWLMQSRLQVIGGVLMILLVPYSILMGMNSTRYYQETSAIPGAHQLGALSLEWGLKLGNIIQENLPPGGVVFADVDEYILNSFAAMPFTVYRNITAPDATLIPAAGGLYIVAYLPDSVPITPPFAEHITTLNLPDKTIITLDRFAPSIGERPLPDEITPYAIPGETWLMLRGYRIEQQNADVMLETLWQVTAPIDAIADTAFTPTAHLFDANGERVAILNGVAIPTLEWRRDDLLVQRFYITLPENGAYTVRVGQYDGVKQMGLIFILPDGNYTDLIPVPIALQVPQ